MGRIADNLMLVRNRIARACERASRNPADVTLIAVGKSFPIEAIREAYDAGQRHFGESRLQEAIPKIEALPGDIIWHFIGPLQSNKAKRAASLFSAIHSFDSQNQIREAAKARSVDALIEVNIAAEPQKSGLPPDLERLRSFRDLLTAGGLRFRGLMTIGPDLGAESVRPYFGKLRELNEQLGGPWLSMGMSGDFEVAIEEGATHIRVGSAIFGSR